MTVFTIVKRPDVEEYCVLVREDGILNPSRFYLTNNLADAERAKAKMEADEAIH